MPGAPLHPTPEEVPLHPEAEPFPGNTLIKGGALQTHPPQQLGRCFPSPRKDVLLLGQRPQPGNGVITPSFPSRAPQPHTHPTPYSTHSTLTPAPDPSYTNNPITKHPRSRNATPPRAAFGTRSLNF